MLPKLLLLRTRQGTTPSTEDNDLSDRQQLFRSYYSTVRRRRTRYLNNPNRSH